MILSSGKNRNGMRSLANRHRLLYSQCLWVGTMLVYMSYVSIMTLAQSLDEDVVDEPTSLPTIDIMTSSEPSISMIPTVSAFPTSPSVEPSAIPTTTPTVLPTTSPTQTPQPTAAPTTMSPTISHHPTISFRPTYSPTPYPSSVPTALASDMPTLVASDLPSSSPTRVYTSMTTANFSISMEGFRVLNALNRILLWEELTSNHTKNYWNSRLPCTVDSKVRNVTTKLVRQRKIRETYREDGLQPDENQLLPDITEIIFTQNITYDINGDIGGYFYPDGTPAEERIAPLESTLLTRPFQDDFQIYADVLFQNFKGYNQGFNGSDQEIVLINFGQWKTEAPSFTPTPSPTAFEPPTKTTILPQDNSALGLILGIVIGCLFGVVTSLLFYFMYRNERKKRRAMARSQNSSVRTTASPQIHARHYSHSHSINSANLLSLGDNGSNYQFAYDDTESRRSTRSDDGSKGTFIGTLDGSQISKDQRQSKQRRHLSTMSSGVLERITESESHETHPENGDKEKQLTPKKEEQEQEPFMLSSHPPSMNDEVVSPIKQEEEEGEAISSPQRLKSSSRGHSFDEHEPGDSLSLTNQNQGVSSEDDTPRSGDDEEYRGGGGVDGSITTLEPMGNIFGEVDNQGFNSTSTPEGIGQSFILQINEIDDYTNDSEY